MSSFTGIITQRETAKLAGKWWGKRHEGPVLPKAQASSLRGLRIIIDELSERLSSDSARVPTNQSQEV